MTELAENILLVALGMALVIVPLLVGAMADRADPETEEADSNPMGYADSCRAEVER